MSRTDSPSVRCSGISKTYGGGDTAVQALRGVDLDVHPGELLMLVGPSGCGKTTLISIIAGILDPTGGACSLFGQDLSSMKAGERVRYRGKRIGFVFQAFNLIPTLTVAENTAIPLLINGEARDKALARAVRCLEEVGLSDKVHALPAQISGGQQQRVAIARALVHDPELVVCDEPTSALDHRTGAKVMEILKRLAMDGRRALVIVTHDARIFSFADRIAHMDDGRIERIESNRQVRQA
jgi:putative ABC transport system ATP-binding protein